MSFCDFFQGCINNFHNVKKITPKIKKEAKELIRQFEISEAYDEFENIEHYKLMKEEINKIRELIF